MRLAALERRIEADLALGRHADVVGELKELVSAHPLREGFRAQLMLALYRRAAGGGAGGLRDARRSLVEELGIDPSPALQELEQAILRQELPPAPKRPPRPAQAASRRARRRGRSSRSAPQSRPPPSPSPSSASPAGTAARRASRGRGWRRSIQRGPRRHVTQAGRTPSNVAVGEDAVWVLDADDRTISQIDPQSGDIVKTFSTGTTPKDIVVGGGALWIGNT